MSIGDQWNLPRNTLIFVLTGLAIAFGIGYWAGTTKSIGFSTNEANSIIMDVTDETKPIKIYICGEVKNPGVYDMTSKNCVLDAVEKAGGLNDKADRKTINLARTLKSGEQIIIQSTEKETSIENGIPPAKSNSLGSKSSSGLLNINIATLEELMELPGIGEVKAAAIIAYRDLNGLFVEVEELDKVSGIGPKTIESIKALITVN